MSNMRYSKLSVTFSLLSIPTAFLVVTIIIFPAIGFILGVKAYRQDRRGWVLPSDREPWRAAFPMLLAVALPILELLFVNATYHA